MRRTILSVAVASLLALSIGPAGASPSGATGARAKCTAGYQPCLVNHHGADYDCAGGGGNGPFYTKPGVVYSVHGSDPYRLDTNHNHKGCEK
jgi:uncharacterized membrane protein